MKIDPTWHFSEAIVKISQRYYPGGLRTGQLRNVSLEHWGELVGRTRALDELEAVLNSYETQKAFCEAYRIAPDTIRRLHNFFAELPDDSVPQFEYDLALSFAGEDRDYVKRIADLGTDKGLNVFYDKYEEHVLLGKDLYQHLDDVYQNKAKYCLIFISESYAQKIWTNHELRSAQARAIRGKEEYIIPVKMDETELPGIRNTIAYFDATTRSPEELVDLILKKLEAT